MSNAWILLKKRQEELLGICLTFFVCQLMYMEICWIPKNSTAESAAKFILILLIKEWSPQGCIASMTLPLSAVPFFFPKKAPMFCILPKAGLRREVYHLAISNSLK